MTEFSPVWVEGRVANTDPFTVTLDEPEGEEPMTVDVYNENIPWLVGDRVMVAITDAPDMERGVTVTVERAKN